MFRDDPSSMSPSTPRAHAVAVGLFALLLAIPPLAAAAQGWDDDPYDYDSSGRSDYADPTGWGTRLGLGFTGDPTSFLIDLTVPYHAGGGVSVGPRIQLGLSKDVTFVAPTLSLEYSHDLRSQVSGPLGNARPLVQAGVGFSSLEKDKRRGNNSEIDFLFDIGVGVEYPLSDGFAVASVIDFNVIPQESLGQTLIFTWQIVQLRVRF